MIFCPGRAYPGAVHRGSRAKQVKNRIHFDLRPIAGHPGGRGRAAHQPRRHVLADRRRDDGSGWVTLADPEGNEFCILRGDAEVTDPYAHLVTASA